MASDVHLYRRERVREHRFDATDRKDDPVFSDGTEGVVFVLEEDIERFSSGDLAEESLVDPETGHGRGVASRAAVALADGFGIALDELLATDMLGQAAVATLSGMSGKDFTAHPALEHADEHGGLAEFHRDFAQKKPRCFVVGCHDEEIALRDRGMYVFRSKYVFGKIPDTEVSARLPQEVLRHGVDLGEADVFDAARMADQIVHVEHVEVEEVEISDPALRELDGDGCSATETHDRHDRFCERRDEAVFSGIGAEVGGAWCRRPCWSECWPGRTGWRDPSCGLPPA